MAQQLEKISGHGGLRGSTSPRTSSNFQGRFGRMFRALPPAEFNDEDLVALAGSGKLPDLPEQETPPSGMNAYPEVKRNASTGKPVRNSDGGLVPSPAPEDKADSEENFGIPTGYTYLGQFIDHDITFDPASSMQKRNDPEALVDFRTPALDLDCLYGRGPDDQPYMFQTDGVRFLLGAPLTKGVDASNARDLPRLPVSKSPHEPQRAVIGDKRNDENVIVSQLHGVFLQFHNAIADQLKEPAFAEVQRLVRWHYQWVVLYDYLPRIVNAKTYKEVFRHLKYVPDEELAQGVKTAYITETDNIVADGQAPNLKYYHWRNEPFMPIEFAAAAYRYGHSMVRPIYRLSRKLNTGGLVGDGRRAIFAGVAGAGLSGFDKFPTDWAIDWDLFFEINEKIGASRTGPNRVQPAYKIDPSLVNPLAFLPEFSLNEMDSDGNLKPQPGKLPNLALRNLRRGNAMELPSGQDVALAMGIKPLTNKEMQVGKAAVGDVNGNRTIQDLIDAAKEQGRSSSFEHGVPLWFYILAESLADWRKAVEAHKIKCPDASEEDMNAVPVRLGPVGGRIVMEVIVGLLLGDPHSFLAQDPLWTPARDWKAGGDGVLKNFIKDGRFGMPELIRVAGLA
ncbi:heme peroxidase family protein [Sulfuriferula sp. GW1]|uniref:peroxidase family protein n=1 Tax=Sulfuriferula sp. GW1 TaxID=3345111 RepID=UPI0039B128CE